MFHQNGGLFFERVKGTGAVHVIKRTEAKDDAPIVFEATIPADEWASIVAAVSINGETNQTFAIARAFHNAG